MLPRAAFASLAVAIALVSLTTRMATAGPPPSGAIVIALGEGSSPAAEALARAVYRDAVLRPAIDDGTARVLAGRPPGDRATAKLREMDELRRAIAPTVGDAAARRLLASLGRDFHAALVVAVSVETAPPPASPAVGPAGADAPAVAPPRVVARVVRTDDATLASVQLSAAQDVAPDGSTRIQWPDAVTTLRALTPSAGPARSSSAKAEAPSTPRGAGADGADSGKKNVWTSAWFWAGLGALVTVGVTVFVIANAAKDDTNNVHLEGRVAP